MCNEYGKRNGKSMANQWIQWIQLWYGKLLIEKAMEKAAFVAIFAKALSSASPASPGRSLCERLLQ